jgi:prepilin-type processing-associated H-X9-DG protein
VQAAREAARRIQCSNNLKQIGLAFHTFHDTGVSFPPGMLCRAYPPGGGWAWGSYILPFMEQVSLYDELQMSEKQPADNYTLARETVLDAYLCPSDPKERVNTKRTRTWASTHDGDVAAASNYVGNAGTRKVSCNASNTTDKCEFDDTGENRAKQMKWHTGILFFRSRVRFRDILDGMANTILVGERDSKSSHHGEHQAAIWIGRNANDINATRALNLFTVSRDGGSFDSPATGNSLLINDGAPGDVNVDGKKTEWYIGPDVCDSWSSQHPGGAQFVLCDGSVKFVTETIDVNTYDWLHHRADGNPLGKY